MAKTNLTPFEKALTEAALSRYQTVLSEDSAPVRFSDAYKSAVAGLSKRSARKTWHFVNTPWKRVLVAVIVLSVLLATTCAAVPAIREGLIRFFTKSDGIVYSFEFSQEDIERAPKEIEQYFAPSDIPPRFELADEAYGTMEQHRFYLDDTGNVLAFTQLVLWQCEEDLNDPAGIAARFGVNAENAAVEDVILQGYEFKVIHFKAPNGTEDMVVLWTDHEYFYFINCPLIENEEIGRIIGSMSPVNPE